jgi:hypothetical protein
MNPPINRENLRDVLIALVVATGLVWVVNVVRELRGQHSPTTTHHLSYPATSVGRDRHPERALISSDSTPRLVVSESRLLRQHA